jgi:hypothetical protein
MIAFNCAGRRSRLAWLGLLALSSVAIAPAAYAQTLPSDAKATCTVPAATFNSWFKSGAPSLNGVVNPANSITFSNPVANCPFYQWSEQMFFWLTSPAPPAYGPSGRVIDTSVFYDVTPPDGAGKRHFIAHSPSFIHVFPVRSAQVGPHGLQVLLDTKGNLLEVVHPPVAQSGNPLVRNAEGNLVEIQSVKVGPANKAIFVDTAGKTINPEIIERGRTVPVERVLPNVKAEMLRNPAIGSASSDLLSGLDPERTVQMLKVTGVANPIFVNFAGNIVEVEQGQADGSVLLTQSDHLIYFAIIVNDVYAYFLTGNKNHSFPAQTKFPTTQAEADTIQAFATGHGGPNPFTDADALTMEIKTAWVEASTLSNPDDYVTTTGQIPVYTKTNSKHWTATGATKTVKLALVGMHVVGSTNGHPEMIWATFEHRRNTPLNSYKYDSTSGTKTVGMNTAGNWLFSASGAPGPASNFNIAHANYLMAPDIEGANGFSITGSNTLRNKPFGGGADKAPNPLIASTAASNTQVIAINNDIQSKMAAKGAASDVRLNYVMSGATWTEGGAPPTSPFPTGNQVGTSRLTNSTMETYQQGPNTDANGLNCLDCHSGNMLGDSGGGGLSHVYGTVKPLF